MKDLIKKILNEHTILILEKMDKQDFIDKSNFIHDSKYDYSLVNYVNNTTPVDIICPIHGKFPQIPKSHTKGYGCWDCGVEKRGKSRRLNLDKFISKAIEIHGNKYNYDLVDYKNSTTPVTIKCPTHGPFTQVPSSHLSGNGCKKCAVEKQIEKQKKPFEKFVSDANRVHNFRYDYSEVVYDGAHKSVNIICPDHGKFPQSPHSHTQGHGCPFCATEKVIGDKRLTKDQFIEKAEAKHNNKFDYSLVNYINYHTPVIIICPIHGQKKQTPANHFNSPYGCVDCASEAQFGRNSKSTEKFVSDANTVHGIGRYDYSKVDYKNSKTPVLIGCNVTKHGIFSQTPSNHLKGQGCPKCNESQGEKFIQSILHSKNIFSIREKKFKDCTNKLLGRSCRQLEFDFYLPDFNTIIEYDGEGHYKPIKYHGGEKNFIRTQKYDKYKDDYCIDNSIQMIRIPYTMKKNLIEPFILKKLNIK